MNQAAPLPDFNVGRLIADYELVQRLGAGSYGDVWRARGVTGAWRAIKIVRRGAFESDRPFAREFEGIQRFEPVAQTHPSQLKLFHIGRGEGFFYYVMELADDAREGQSEYAPKTLRSELSRRERLPINECVAIASSLAEALAHLHKHGLVHRDIKPANIILVEGAPKLADIGLVAATDRSLSCVGTEGYLPPEGPGKPAADVFSLGKVFYEMSTGCDRTRFPELPALWESAEEREAFAEFNEVIAKACDPEARRRYQSGEEMLADLSLLRSGVSLQAVRWRERVAWRGLTAAAVAAVMGLLWIGFSSFRRQGPQARLAPRQLNIKDAVFWTPSVYAHRQFDVSPDGNKFVFFGTNGLSIWDRETSITRPLAVAMPPGWRAGARFGTVRWAPNSEQVMFRSARQTESGAPGPTAFFLVHTKRGTAQRIGPEFGARERPLGFTWLPDGRAITYMDEQQRIYSLSLSGGRSLWLDTKLLPARGISIAEYSPDGNWLLISADSDAPDLSESRNLWLLPHLGGRAIPLTEGVRFNAFPTWGADGRTIYYVSGGDQPLSQTRGIWKLRINPRTGERAGQAIEVFSKQGQRLLHPRFIAGAKRLVYGVEEPFTQIVAAHSADLRAARHRARGRSAVLSPDGNTIYFAGESSEQQGIYALEELPGSVPRQVTALVPHDRFSLSPDGRWIALLTFARNRFVICLVATDRGQTRVVVELPRWNAVTPVWSPDGQSLAFSIDGDLYRFWPETGRRDLLASLYRWEGFSLCWSPDGKHLAGFGFQSAEDWEERVHLYVVSITDGTLRKLTHDTEDQYKAGLDWHPDGKRLTYHSYDGGKVKWAFVDGRPTVPMIDQPDHWDYVGRWSPDGRNFVFRSDPCAGDERRIHVFDLHTGVIDHAVRRGNLPQWSADGTQQIWEEQEKIRYFEVLENFE